MSNASAKKPVCNFCNRQGLPILPVRYAIGRTDRGNAPVLPLGFGDGVTSIQLPDSVRYTLRLLRSGFLYTFDEHRREWRAYVVNEQSYLQEFAIHAESPPNVEDKIFGAACRAKGDPYRARCFTVKDAARATNVWVGFSDVAWTANVRKAYEKAILDKTNSADATERRSTLQRIDVAAWRDRKPTPHMATFDAIRHVAEFVADGAALHRDTLEYVKGFLPPPYTNPIDLLEIVKPSEADKPSPKTQARELISPKIRELLDSNVNKPAPTEGRWDCAAWKFSVQPILLASSEASSLIAWGNAQAKPLQPIMFGVSDPAGIAMDLNGLAIQRNAEFMDATPRRWMFETAQMIEALKEAVGKGAVEAKKEAAGSFSQVFGHPAALNPAFPFMPTAMRQRLTDAAALVHAKEAEKVEQRADQIANDAWAEDYRERLRLSLDKKETWETYLLQHESERKKFTDNILANIDKSYVAWLDSPSIRNVFKLHYDSTDFRSGEAYMELALLLINESCGRRFAAELIFEQAHQDPDDRSAWLARAYLMNNNALIKACKGDDPESERTLEDARTRANLELKKDATRIAISWSSSGEKLHDKIKEIIVYGAGTATSERYFDKAARLVYQTSGALFLPMNLMLDKGVKVVMKSSLQLGLIRAIAKGGNSDLVIVNLHEYANVKDAINRMTKEVAPFTGVGARRLRSPIHHITEEKFPGYKENNVRIDGVAFIDKKLAAELLPGLDPQARNAAIVKVLTVKQRDAVVSESLRKVASLEVSLGFLQVILSALALRSAYNDMVKATAEEKLDKTANFAAGFISLVGGLSSVSGAILSATAWGNSPLSRPIKFGGFYANNNAGWLTGVGKLLGAIGGFVSGVLALREGYDLLRKNKIGKRILLTAAGFATAALSVVAIFTTSAAPLGLLVGLCASIVMVVVAWLTFDEVQKWLDQSLYFGKGDEGKFNAPFLQMEAFQKLSKG